MTLRWMFPFFRSGVQALSVRPKTTWGGNHNATPSTLGVLYFLLVVEGQGAHPRASGIRKQVWVCSADAGVCHALKAAGTVNKDICISKIKRDVIREKWAGT